jgi:hypothetical protein
MMAEGNGAGVISTSDWQQDGVRIEAEERQKAACLLH